MENDMFIFEKFICKRAPQQMSSFKIDPLSSQESQGIASSKIPISHFDDPQRN